MQQLASKSRRQARVAFPVGVALVLACLMGLGPNERAQQAEARDGLRAAPRAALGGSRADLGERQLERLPGNWHVLRADLSKDRPVAIAGFYVMKRNLLIVTQAGALYCMDRFNLEPRWVNTLKAPLARPPAEGANHFTLLCKDYRGKYWLHAISKRSGQDESGFPKALHFAASSGVAANASMAFMGSLGSSRHNKTFESVNLLSARGGWGYLAPGLLKGDPQMDASGKNVLFCTDNAHLISLPASAMPPSGPNWTKKVGNYCSAGVALSPTHVFVANKTGVLHSVAQDNGHVAWIADLGDAVNSAPWVLGGVKTVKKDSEIEGADPITSREFVGMVLARNVRGLHAFDAKTGEPLFRDLQGGRPMAVSGDWLMTVDSKRQVTFRNIKKDYEPSGERLELQMFDLIPTNRMDGAVYAATSDGGVCAAIPR